jgi:hypothetical protein
MGRVMLARLSTSPVRSLLSRCLAPSTYFIALLYVSVIGISVAGAAFGLVAVTKLGTELSQQAPQEKTLLDLRMESFREVQQALAKPQPHPEPLPPITTRVTHAARSAVSPSKADQRKLMDEARGAFARIEPSSGVQPSAFAEPDRHAVR